MTQTWWRNSILHCGWTRKPNITPAFTADYSRPGNKKSQRASVVTQCTASGRLAIRCRQCIPWTSLTPARSVMETLITCAPSKSRPIKSQNSRPAFTPKLSTTNRIYQRPPVTIVMVTTAPLLRASLLSPTCVGNVTHGKQTCFKPAHTKLLSIRRDWRNASPATAITISPLPAIRWLAHSRVRFALIVTRMEIKGLPQQLTCARVSTS